MNTVKDKFKKSLEEYLDLRYTYISDLDHFTNGYCMAKNEILVELNKILSDGHEPTIVSGINKLRDEISRDVK